MRWRFVLSLDTNHTFELKPVFIFPMEEKRRDAAPQPPSNADSPAPEPAATSRRRGGAQKRKASALSASNSSSTPSKRITREKPLPPPHTPSLHNGPLTRARQIPSNLSCSAAVSFSTAGGGSASAPAAVKHWERVPQNGALGGDSVVALTAEELNKESEWEALEAAIEARFEAIRSRVANAHVVPTHCGEASCLFRNPNLSCASIWELYLDLLQCWAGNTWCIWLFVCFLLCWCSANNWFSWTCLNYCMTDRLSDDVSFVHLQFASL